MKLPPFEISVDAAREGGRVLLTFRYERQDPAAAEYGPGDGQAVQLFAGLINTIGEALKQGRSPKEIQTAIDAAVESFEKIQAARKARQQEETPTHG